MFDLVKWQILLKVLPLTLLFCVAKVGVHSFGLEPWDFDSLIGALFGAATFIIALVLSGTLSDYRTSEGATEFSKNLTVSAFMFTSFFYLLILIRDLDNPFQYDGQSSVDVSLAPLQTVCQQLQK
ncbi:MAG: hypothetical protein Kow00121_19760 [Elainellaceae cyanobacterium]